MTTILAIIGVLGFFMVLAMCSMLKKPGEYSGYPPRDLSAWWDTPRKCEDRRFEVIERERREGVSQ